MGDAKWIAGAPTVRGSYWIVWQKDDGSRIVVPVDVSPALIHWNAPDARLLLKMLGGAAYDYDRARARIAHHMPMVAPGFEGK